LVSTGIEPLDQILLDGYPDKSAILVTGPPGTGKEALGYWFIHSGLVQGDYCLYVTHRPVSDVLRDMRGFGIKTEPRVPDWIASSGSPNRCDLRDHTSVSFNIKQSVIQNKQRRARIVTDVLSPLLVLNSSESMYAYWSQLIAELKQYDVVVLALADEGMHPAQTLAAMEQLFDGLIEMKLYEEGLTVIPLLKVRKMIGQPPMLGNFRFSFTHTSMEIIPHVK
jgi:KaiC/GvpD/RAD55 family RecA-like ATPase